MQLVVSEPEQHAHYIVIWMHGLGAGYEDMAGLAQAINWSNEQTRQIFLQAPERPVTINAGLKMPAWYDILGGDLTSRQDCEGVRQSSELIEKVVTDQINQGYKAEQIFLVGFSQGGAIALYTGLRLHLRLGGIAALSAYIPCVDQLRTNLDTTTPIFLGHGRFDPLVLPQWTKLTSDYLQNHGFYTTTLKSYLIEHAVSPEEIADLEHWFATQMAGESK